MSETVIETFRTAVGGFNKTDVTNYIAKTAAENDRRLKEQESENSFLRQRNDLLENRLSELEKHSDDYLQEESDLRQAHAQLQTDYVAQQQKLEDLQARLDGLQAQYEALQNRNTALQQENAVLQAQGEALQTQLAERDRAAAEVAAAGAVQASDEPAITELELAAYRRAESAERIAVERAKRINGEVEALFTTAVAHYTDTDAQIQAVITALQTQNAQMQQICVQLAQSRNDTRQQFETVCGREFFPQSEEET